MNNQSIRKQGERYTTVTATERDPLILSSPPGYSGASNIRERRSRTTSPALHTQQQQYHSDQVTQKDMSIHKPSNLNPGRINSSFAELPGSGRVPPPLDEADTSYEIYSENDNINRPVRSIRSIRSARSQRDSRFNRTFSDGRYGSAGEGGGDRLHQYYNERANRIFSDSPSNDEPLVEVSDEIMTVRKSALKVYEPLTYTWVSSEGVVALFQLCCFLEGKWRSHAFFHSTRTAYLFTRIFIRLCTRNGKMDWSANTCHVLANFIAVLDVARLSTGMSYIRRQSTFYIHFRSKHESTTIRLYRSY